MFFSFVFTVSPNQFCFLFRIVEVEIYNNEFSFVRDDLTRFFVFFSQPLVNFTLEQKIKVSWVKLTNILCCVVRLLVQDLMEW